ncbi:pyridoxal phosphate-dependent transferase [Halteromyces radiatus]|uniref:pyridoxal phosphate-dependent transferase n=1 Tax=Halteromyces radiatus TaxID=101107 RepID=UPI002220407E|nr:pyridoxal phosphate-dependent transferase [Halteromyces radiatus]KAI8092792.1 pyridoxal phosphate-dependent transferase [Halteromyces radiatus]
MPLSIHPSRAFQAYQIFSANTNVGKTIFATGLCRAAAEVASSRKNDHQLFYLKPIQTGYPVDSDERHVKTFNPSNLQSQTLYAYPDPVSPHIATDKPPSDDKVLLKTKQYMLDCIKKSRDGGAYFFLETAGGIHSPVMSGTSQADFYRAFRLPTILIGDGQLGGISTTTTSFESLHIRGYDVPSILLFDHERCKNHELLSTRLGDQKIDITAVPPPPSPNPDPTLDQQAMKKYYEQLDEYLVPVMERLDLKHQERFDRLESMAEKSRETFWWPFTQHNMVKEVTVIDSAHQDHFVTYTKPSSSSTTTNVEAKEMFDSCASWWTQGLGHGNPKLTLAAAYAAGRYGHVMFPECGNESALSLAEKVLERDTWASRVFYSDNGSTAMEVALKMAMRTAAKRYGWLDGEERPVDILGIDGSYHGDTIGTMDACSPNVYNEQVQWYKPRGHWLQPPSVHISQGKPYVQVPKQVTGKDAMQVGYDSVSTIYSVDQQNDQRDPGLANIYRQYIRKELDGLRQQGRQIGALLMEPLIMGAGGMIFVDPLFQRTLVDVIRNEGKDLLGYKNVSASSSSWQGLPIVFDEVFTGWYRLGRSSASDFLGVKPDIVAYAKTLTGGLLPLALTVTKESIFDTFLSDNKPDCLLHGHSYTAHPMGTEVAKQTIDILDNVASNGTWQSYQQSWKQQDGSNTWSMWNWHTVQQISHLPNVESVMALGSVLAVNLKDDQTKGYGSAVSASVIQQLRHGNYLDAAGTNINLFARPLGNVIYLMTSQVTSAKDIEECERILLSTLTNNKK